MWEENITTLSWLSEGGDDGNMTTPSLLMVAGKSSAGHSVTTQVIINTFYILGIIGNLTALFILHKEKKARYKNKKHSLMLRCLAGNDLVGLLGMLIQFNVNRNLASMSHTSCFFRVIWRGFGLSSGSVALVMAIERWLALTHPFLYQKRVTYHFLLKAILGCWTVVVVLTSMPLFGFGLYFDPVKGKCLRYRDATEPKDIAYSYVIFVFVSLMCMGIAWANLAVTKYLCHSGHTSGDYVGRRISRAKKRSVSKQPCVRVECLNEATPDEIAFARLMVALSITVLVCWIPNLLAIPLAQLFPTTSKIIKFSHLADVLLAFHFTLDPYVYVILHHYFSCLRITFDALQRHCCCGPQPDDLCEDSSLNTQET